MLTASETLGRVVVSATNAWRRAVLRRHGLRRRTIHLPDSETDIVCWMPKDVERTCNQKPSLLLLHGFGSNGTESWASHVSSLSRHFALFIPDLLFFGSSTTSRLERSELFQAHCIHTAILSLGVNQSFVMAHSYGGFVAYRLAHLYPEFVTKLIIVASGIMMDCHNNDYALRKTGANSVYDILAPTSVPALKQTLELVLNGTPKIPDFVLKAMLKNPNRDHHVELIDALEIGKYETPSYLPKVSQKTLILWGEKDQIFNIKLAFDFKLFLGATAEVKVFKEQGHVPQFAQSFDEEVISFLRTNGSTE
ncbi:hypothetical protein KP509_37G048700 [Ceratopteris richardii]|uniref:AB hydrolase-1 domain-containing protein n=1 Tax=Ceratopteris richardii TaxID=49495 RepID=A0A8T2Q8R5_CERRI|nr:hypothetical protein KP509_37G048700 [Ceratopteris richardii]